jgi:hypothetical protein
MKSIRSSSAVSLRAAIGQQKIVAFNVGPLGEFYLVLALEPMDYQTQPDGFAVFPKTMPDAPQRYRVIVVRDGLIETDTFIEGEPFNIHEVQPIGDDELLLVCSRSSYRGPEDFDLNGRIYTRDGRFLRAILMGDGIETVQATRRGELWTSYFDEGVFGNFGWNDPVGAAGLIAFSSQGEKLYAYEPPAGLDAICDCYALNVATADDVWCCYYTDFPLVHLRKQSVMSTWASPVHGAHAFAVTDDHALFAGGYEGRDLLTLVKLGPEGSVKKIGVFQLQDDDGGVINAQRTVGRGSSLYLLCDGVVHQLAIEDVLATLSARHSL